MRTFRTILTSAVFAAASLTVTGAYAQQSSLGSANAGAATTGANGDRQGGNAAIARENLPTSRDGKSDGSTDIPRNPKLIDHTTSLEGDSSGAVNPKKARTLKPQNNQ